MRISDSTQFRHQSRTWPYIGLGVFTLGVLSYLVLILSHSDFSQFLNGWWIPAFLWIPTPLILYHLVKRCRLQEVYISTLESRFIRSQVHASNLQLQPHFLFNTLHTISMLVRRGDERAVNMIAELSDLLRYAIQHAPEEEVTLRKEIVFLKQYLAIQQTGRQNPFLISWDIDSRVDQTLVPTLLLQPLLENSIRHGLSSGKGFGCIDILARQMGSRLFLQVRDNGTGLPEDWSFEQYAGIGLRNTKARLFQMFGTNHSFRISNVPEGGLCISLSIPFRTQSATPHLDLAA